MPQRPLSLAVITTQIPGKAYLLLAVTIFGAAGAVTQRIIELGEQHTLSGRNPISFCNLLFVGNLCALMLLIPLYRQQLSWQQLQHLSRRDWLSLILVGTLAGAIAPMLTFMALANTSVNNVILLGRIEPPLSLVLSLLFLRERTNLWVICGAIVAFLGVALTILLAVPDEPMVPMAGFELGIGMVMAAGAAIAAASATVISQASLPQISLGLFSIVRTAIGTIIFLSIVLSLFGPTHFRDVFSPFLWQWTFIYSAIIVVIGQLAWFAGLRASSTSEISLASSFTPIAGILAAYWILGETPTSAQYTGGFFIIVGIGLNHIGIQRYYRSPPRATPDKRWKLLDIKVGYKGI